MSTRQMFRNKSKKRHASSKDDQKIDNSDVENSNTEKEKTKRIEKTPKITNIRQQISENDSEDERKSPKNNKQRDRKRSNRSDVSDRSLQEIGPVKTNPISRDISIEGQISIDAQIERGIMGLVEKDIARIEKKQYPPRPQSLSFYEDELSPTDADLSGQLQTLSPNEKTSMNRGYGPYGTMINANANVEIDGDDYRKLEGVFQRGGETSINLKGSIKIPKPKSRKNKQGDDVSMGDSREEIIPGKVKKSRKKRDESPASAGKKSRKNIQFDNQSFYNEGYEPNTDMTVALQDLQDDVFEGPAQVHGFSEGSPNYNHRCPERSDKVYVQRSDNKFQAVPRERIFSCDVERKDEPSDMPSPNMRSFRSYTPLKIAVAFQKFWGSRISYLIFGLLAGISLMHIILLGTVTLDVQSLLHYSHFSHAYASIFLVFCMLCTVAVFDKYDVSYLDVAHIQDFWLYRKSFIVILIYPITLLITLVTVDEDNKISYLSAVNYNETAGDDDFISKWKSLSFCRASFALVGWIVIAFGSKEDLLYEHLDSMSKYNTEALQFSQS